MIVFGFVFLGMGVLWLLGCLFNRVCLKGKQWIPVCLILIGGLVCIAFTIVPPDSWDLSRHYDLIKSMQQGGLSYVLNESIYKHLPIINLLYGFVAYLGVPHLLPCIVLVICYAIFAYILADYAKVQTMDSKFIVCMIIFNLAMCPFLHMVSGIRNILAYAICALALHLEFYKDRKLCAGILLLLSISIHPASLLIIAVRVLLPVFTRWRWIGILAAAWSLFAAGFAKILLQIPVYFLNSVGWKLLDYAGDRVFSGYKILFVKAAFFISVIVWIEYFIRKKKLRFDGKSQRYLSAFELTVLVAVGSFRVPFVADRLCYFLAFFSVPALAILDKACEGRRRHLFFVETLVVVALLFVHQILYFSST